MLKCYGYVHITTVSKIIDINPHTSQTEYLTTHQHLEEANNSYTSLKIRTAENPRTTTAVSGALLNQYISKVFLSNI